jgi:hypothetical protein
MTTILIVAGLVYLAVFMAGNNRRCNPWGTTLVDRFVVFPIEGALRIVSAVFR